MDAFAFMLDAVGMYFLFLADYWELSASYATPTKLKCSFKSLCFGKKRDKIPILINLKNNRCKNKALKMSGENSSIIFSLISGSRVILIYSWVTWESLCRYPQVTEFTSWLKSCMKISDPKIVPLWRNTQLRLRQVQRECHLNANVSLASTWSRTWLLTLQGNPIFLKSVHSPS